MTENEIIQRAIAAGATAAEPELYALVNVALSRVVEAQIKSGELFRNNRFIVETTNLTIGASNSVVIASACNVKRIRNDLVPLSTLVFVPPGIQRDRASGTWTFARQPAHNELLYINTSGLTFRVPDAVAAGAGSGAANGTFTCRGEYKGYPFWCLTSEPDSITRFAIIYDEASDRYIHTDADGFRLYASIGPLPSTKFRPWDLDWAPVTGVAPVPTYTKGALAAEEVEIGENVGDTVANLHAWLQVSVDPNIMAAFYETDAAANAIIGTSFTIGVGGEAFVMEPSTFGAISVSGTTLTGGIPNALAAQIKTVRFVKSRDRLTLGGRQDQNFILAFIDGDTMHLTLGGDPSFKLGGLAFKIRSVAVPTAIVDLPDDSLVGDIVAELVAIAPKKGSAGERGLALAQQRV